MFATTNADGMLSMTVPDICTTLVGIAVAPLPYPNMGMAPTVTPTALMVIIAGGLSLTSESMIEPTNGDEAGITGGGGVACAEIMGGAKYTTSSMTVMIEGMPAVRLTDTVTMNEYNTVGVGTVPSQLTVMIMS
jgi:small ligand-binding sensory domain FIST